MGIFYDGYCSPYPKGMEIYDQSLMLTKQQSLKSCVPQGHSIGPQPIISSYEWLHFNFCNIKTIKLLKFNLVLTWNERVWS